jgi:ubiquinone/menaquinone biosynthesis C-methylase UbiE
MTFNIQAVEEATRVAVENGYRVLQAHRFDQNDMLHVRRLALWADIPNGSRVVDMGSGIGEVARLWRFTQPDIEFCLVNISQAQIDMSPPDIDRHCCDMLDVPEPDGAFDAAICLFSIGHVDRFKAFREMARLVRFGGIVFVYDMVRVSGDNVELEELAYRVDGREVMEDYAQMADLRLDFYLEPVDGGWFGPNALGDDFDRYFGDVKPAIWRFRRNHVV